MSRDGSDNKENAGQNGDEKKDEIPYPRFSPKVERLIYRIGIYTLLAMIALTLFGIYIYYQNIDSLIKLMIYVSCAGGIGGSIYSAQGLTKHYINKDFNPDYRYWYYARPVLAIFTGAISLIIITVGLIAFGGSNVGSVFITNANATMSNSTSIPLPDFKQPLIFDKALLFCAISFLGGYSTTTLLKRMEAVAKTIFGDVNGVDKDLDEIKGGIKQIQSDLEKNNEKIAELEKAKKP